MNEIQEERRHKRIATREYIHHIHTLKGKPEIKLNKHKHTPTHNMETVGKQRDDKTE